MIEATEADIGRRVFYSHPIVRNGARTYGTITAVDRPWISVKYESEDYPGVGSIKTGEAILFWADGKRD